MKTNKSIIQNKIKKSLKHKTLSGRQRVIFKDYVRAKPCKLQQHKLVPSLKSK